MRRDSRSLWAVLTLAAVLPAAAWSQRAVGIGTPGGPGGLPFAADVVVVPDLGGGGTVEVTYAVTYGALVFLRSDAGYRARYEVTLILHDGRGRQVAGDSWERAVEVPRYEDTGSHAEAAREVLTLSAEPGRYRLTIALRSLDAKAAGTIEQAIEVPRVVPGRLTLGTLAFRRKEVGAAGELFVPAPAREYGEDHPDVRVVVRVYGDPGPTCRLSLAVSSEDGIVRKSVVDTVAQSTFATEHPFDFSALDLDVGSYVVRAELELLDGASKVSSSARFRVVTSPKSWGEDFEKMLAQISYVATRDEVESLRAAPEEERVTAWEAFWEARDPDPSTEENEFRTEFLRRLGHVNARFRSSVEGWQTDMGRVYIQHGEPDDVDSQPIGPTLNAWEVWYYYGEHTKYVFVDSEGFGEFRLVEVSRI